MQTRRLADGPRAPRSRAHGEGTNCTYYFILARICPHTTHAPQWCHALTHAAAGATRVPRSRCARDCCRLSHTYPPSTGTALATQCARAATRRRRSSSPLVEALVPSASFPPPPPRAPRAREAPFPLGPSRRSRQWRALMPASILSIAVVMISIEVAYEMRRQRGSPKASPGTSATRHSSKK
jgi:hypothetical protein